MKKKRNYWLIVSSIITSVIIVFVGTFMLTKLSRVSVEFTSRLSTSETRLESGILDKVKTSGEFDFKKSVLFINVDENAAKIEKANPFVKVERIVRKFPNKICVYISERKPKYRIRETNTSTNWYILDEEFKVLEFVDSEEYSSKSYATKTVEISYILQKTYVGDFVNKTEDKNNINEIMAGVKLITDNYFVIKSISFDSASSTYLLTATDGCELKIIGLSNLKTKAQRVAYVHKGDDSSLPTAGLDLSQKRIVIDDSMNCSIQNKD